MKKIMIYSSNLHQMKLETRVFWGVSQADGPRVSARTADTRVPKVPMAVAVGQRPQNICDSNFITPLCSPTATAE